MQHSQSPLQQLRTLHPNLQHIQQSPDGSLFPQDLRPELHNLNPNDAVYHQQHYSLGPQPSPHVLQYEPQAASQPQAPFQYAVSYQHGQSPRYAPATAPLQNFQPPRPTHHIPLPPAPQPQSPRRTVHPSPQRGPFSQLVTPVPPPQQQIKQQAQSPPQDGDSGPSTGHGQFQGLKMIANPPNLEAWRRRLFDVDDMITLDEDEFQTYFPHIDNVYSHRSTQRHKRKCFVSHYWDCRLKGRPPGTKKSTDPEKKKRKRVARERDLCDVKIKITEYFDQDEYEEQLGHRPPGADMKASTSPVAADAQRFSASYSSQNQQFFGQTQMMPQRSVDAWGMPSVDPPGTKMHQFTAGSDMSNLTMSGTPPKKYYTFQRVNGNGGNGKGDGVAGPHKHTLEDSDRVKKNSVIRWLAKCEKDGRGKSQGGDPSKKTYHKKATGNALTTVKNHSKDDDLKIYGSAFCPFVQRVWISLEHKHIPYQYIEVDPYKKPQSLLDVNPRGLVPALRHGPTWSTHESTVIMEYLEDLNTGPALFPPDAQARATSRLWTDHINRHIIPLFYKLLQAQDTADQVTHAKEFRDQINKLVAAADPTGPFFLGPHMSFVDVQIAPWIVRLRRVLGQYRGWPEAEEGSRWKAWIDAVEEEESVRMTTSSDELYLDSYERYAENRPGTSQVADAVNRGGGLP